MFVIESLRTVCVLCVILGFIAFWVGMGAGKEEKVSASVAEIVVKTKATINSAPSWAVNKSDSKTFKDEKIKAGLEQKNKKVSVLNAPQSRQKKLIFALNRNVLKDVTATYYSTIPSDHMIRWGKYHVYTAEELSVIKEGAVIAEKIAKAGPYLTEKQLRAILIADKSQLGQKRLMIHDMALALSKKKAMTNKAALKCTSKDVVNISNSVEVNTFAPVINMYWTEKPEEAYAVFWYESRFKIWEVYHGNGDDNGICQINWPSHKGWLSRCGIRRAELFDPIINLAAGRIIYSRAGNNWGPWVAASKVGLR